MKSPGDLSPMGKVISQASGPTCCGTELRTEMARMEETGT